MTLPAYGLLAQFAWAIEASGALPQWAEPAYAAIFVVPVLVLCWPWYPLLSQWGLMQGDWIRLPSSFGVALVFGVYTVGAVLAGMLFTRWRRQRSVPADATSPLGK